jgi:RNA polymerase sigma factor (sigma-70 family)
VQAHAEPSAHEIAVDEAFERLYRSYARDVYRYSLALLRNPTDAEDITQTTFLNAYRAYQRGEEPRRPRSWLITIAHNACRSRHLRAVRRPQEVPFEETIAAMPAPAEEAPKLEELLEALGRLPFNQRAALVMRELEGRSYAEIAETLELSVAAVETLIFRGRRALRRDRSLVGVLGSVQLPPSLGGLFGGGGGAGAVAGGGLAVGSGLLVKAAIVVAAGVVAGAIGPVVGARITHQPKRAGIELSPLTVAATKRATVATATAAAIRVLRGPMVVVKRQGRTFVVTEGAVGVGAAVPFNRGIAVSSGAAPQAEQLTAAPVLAEAAVPAGASAAPAGASVASALPSSGSVTQAVTTTANTAAAPVKTATTQVTQAVETVTTAAGALPVSTAPLPTSTVAAPPPPPLPVDTSPVTSALPPIPTVTLPQVP